MSLTPGTKLGAFEITGLLGKGGMGEVYRAGVRSWAVMWRLKCCRQILRLMIVGGFDHSF